MAATVLEVDNMFDAYCVVSRWKRELAELRKLGIPAGLISEVV